MIELKQTYKFIKNKPRVFLIWFSCFDKERSIQEISKIWNYKSYVFLCYGQIHSKMLQHKLLSVTKLEKKQIFFKSNFDIYFELINYIVNEEKIINKEFYEELLKDKNIFIKVIDSEEYRKIFLDVFLIKKLFKNNRELVKDYNILLFIPLFPLTLLITLKIFVDTNKNIDFEKLKEITINIYNFLWNTSLNFLDINEYFKSINEKLTKETFDKLTKDLDKTELYSKYKLQTEIFKQFSASIIKQQ